VGGDEFVVIVEPRLGAVGAGIEDGDVQAGDRAVGALVARRIGDAVRRPVAYDGALHAVTASIGMTHARHSAGDAQRVTAEAVLKDADGAMYRAKSRGRDLVEVQAGP
jgi:GGDEF domain-containing protein